MANAVYPKYKQSLLAGDANADLDNDTSTDGPFIALVDTGTYAYNASHQFYSSLSGVVGTDQRISTPTVTNGTLDGDDLTYLAVTGASVEALISYRKNSGANTTWRLVFYEDTGVTGLPVTPNGGNIVVTWNVSGVFLISDAREKENILQIGELGSIGVYEYNYNGNEQRARGVLAQEVERVVPSAVTEVTFAGRRRKAVCYDEVVRLLAA